MKALFFIIALSSVVGAAFGLFAIVAGSPAQGGPILISSALYLGLFSIAYVIEDRGNRK
jgi:hypothetical protein